MNSSAISSTAGQSMSPNDIRVVIFACTKWLADVYELALSSLVMSLDNIFTFCATHVCLLVFITALHHDYILRLCALDISAWLPLVYTVYKLKQCLAFQIVLGLLLTNFKQRKFGCMASQPGTVLINGLIYFLCTAPKHYCLINCVRTALV